MPNGDFEQQSVNQSVVVSDSDSQEENSQQKPENYRVLYWEGESLSQIPFPFRTNIQNLKDFKNLSITDIKNIFQLQDDGQIQDGARYDITLNDYQTRGLQASSFLKTIKIITDNEFQKLENVSPTIETLNNSIEALKESCLALTSNKTTIENFSKSYNVVSNDKEDLANSLSIFSNQELTDLLNSFFDKLKAEIGTRQNSSTIEVILKQSSNITQDSLNAALINFLNDGIEKSKIAKTKGSRKALPLLLEGAPLSLARTLLAQLFIDSKYNIGSVNYDNAKFIFKTQETTGNIIGEITLPISVLMCDGETRKSLKNLNGNKNYIKKLNNQNKLVDLEIGEAHDESQYKPLFIPKLIISISSANETDDAEISILSYEIKIANNFDLNNICCDAGLIRGFKNIMDELNSLDGSYGEAIFKFATNWVNYAYVDLPKESKIRTSKPIPGGDEDIESLELIAKFYFQTNPEALITFNKKLACLEYLDPWNPESHYYLIMLKSFHKIINSTIKKDGAPDDLFTLNVAQRKEQFANFSGIIHSISEKLTEANNLFNANFSSDSETDITEHERNKQTNLYSLTCDFISLALTLEKLQLTKDLFKFKDFVHFKQYDGNALQGWKNIIKIAKSNSGGDKEIISYLEKGVEYFESLVNPNNANNLVEVDNYVEGITKTLKIVSSNAKTYDQFKAHIIINPLAKQREFCENKFTGNAGNEFSEKLINIEKLIHKEAVEEFAAGKTLKQVARGEAAQICDKTTKLINTAVSQKSTAEKKAEIHKYKKETSVLTTKEIIWSAVAAIAAAAITFIGGFSLARFAIKYGWFNYQAKQQSDKIARCADEFNAATEKQPQRSASVPSC